MTCASVIFAAPRRIEIHPSPRPRPGVGEILVAAECSAISSGTELLVYRGQVPAGTQVDSTIAALRHEAGFPQRYGYSMVGRVVELGTGVDAAWMSRRVFAFHPHESHFVTVPEQVTALPDDVESEAATLLPNVETAVNLVQDGRPMLGERVAVFGQGVVGLLTAGLLSRFPLAGLVAVDPMEARRAASLRVGAHACVPPGADELHDFDLCYEVSGNPAVLNHAIAATRFSGRVVVGSWYGGKRAEIDLGGSFHRSRIRIVSSQVSTIDPSLCGAWTRERRLQLALSMLKLLRPALLVTHRFSFEQAAEAFALLDERPQEALQVILTYGSPC